MIPHSWIILCLLSILIYKAHPVDCDPCTILNLAKVDGDCTAQIDCHEYIEFDVKTWDCIKHTTLYQRRRNYDYGYYNEERTTYDDNYNLIINVTDPREMDLFLVNMDHFTKLTLNDGDLVTIPEEIYKTTSLQELKILGNKISTISFNNFLPMSALSEITLRDNLISVIDMGVNDDALIGSQLSNVKTIDLSINLIEIPPNNFVSRFIQLQHLNLSHNRIHSIGILTFEGIVQLQTLDLSQNRLLQVGNAFARFVNLKELSISNNNIIKLFDYNFVTLTNLKNLNASYNDIVLIENNTFQSLTELEVLDLGNNKLETVSQNFFKSNTKLRYLSFSDNQIHSIEVNSFKDMHISEFLFQNNRLLGVIEKNTFKGIDVKELNLSSQNLTRLEDEAFVDMINLNNLNLSSNSISNISHLAFSSLVSLNILDLSHNDLNELYFESVSLRNLSKLYAHHNKIKKITRNVFENFVSLTELDLSFNNIIEIESQSFLTLNKIELINIQGNKFVTSLKSKALEGLTAIQEINMSGMRTTCFRNESFSGLISLTKIKATFGQLTEIEYNAFQGSNSLEILTLSNNQLRYFHVNTSTISQIQEIYLNDNCLKNVTNETFSHLTLLRILNLANNDIFTLSSDVFQYCHDLMYLDLSSNIRMKIVGNAFQNLSKLYSLSLENVKTQIAFDNSNVSFEVLDIQSCGISNINKVNIFNVQGLTYLNLSMNEITTINKDSFRIMPTLVGLDLSLNNIIYIQPGSFLHTKRLTMVNLYGNNLPSLQFGVFDGAEVLRDLNLSSNVLSNFDVKLLPAVSKLSLDDNIINNLNFEDFFNTDISELSIGGNQISCKLLAELKISNLSEKFKRIVTAKKLNYHTENVNGISCQTTANDVNIIANASNQPSLNISPLISNIRNALEKFGNSLQSIGENINNTGELKNEAKNVIKSLESFIESSNKNQITNNEYLTRITDLHNDSNIQLTEIKKYLKLLIDRNEFETDASSNTKSPMDNGYVNLEFQKMLKQEADILRKEFQNALASISKGAPIHEPLTAKGRDTNDTNAIFYFIAICLAVILAVYIGNVVFGHVIRLRHSYNTRSSTTPISNSMEMLE